MSLSELSAAIPERLPASLNFADLGSTFNAVIARKSIHLQPSSGNSFGPEGIRIIRINITSQDYMLPETFRVQFKFTVDEGVWRPLSTPAALFDRVRVISQGVVISDESHSDRLQCLHHEWMSKDQYQMLAAEGWNIEKFDDDGSPIFEKMDAGESKRINMSFITTPLFTQKKLIPLRYCPLVVELQLSQNYTNISYSLAAGETAPKYTITDANALCDTLQLDPALDNVLAERHMQDQIPIKMREWSTMKHSNNSLRNAEWNVQILKGVTRLCVFIFRSVDIAS